jgi:two-component system chemotaxis sensor kinase CheA
MDDLLSEFLTETVESISVLDNDLVKLEQNPNDPELLGNIFRLLHTIKGTCGFLGLPRLEAVAHAAEDVLGKIRDGELEVTADAVSLILEAIDQIKMIIAVLEDTEAEPEGDDRLLIERLRALMEPVGASAAVVPAAEAEGDKDATSGTEAAAEDDGEAVEAAAGGSLYDQIGGEGAVSAAVDVFYRKVLPLLRRDRHGRPAREAEGVPHHGLRRPQQLHRPGPAQRPRGAGGEGAG